MFVSMFCVVKNIRLRILPYVTLVNTWNNGALEEQVRPVCKGLMFENDSEIVVPFSIFRVGICFE